jgi:hypothetical protein
MEEQPKIDRNSREYLLKYHRDYHREYYRTQNAMIVCPTCKLDLRRFNIYKHRLTIKHKLGEEIQRLKGLLEPSVSQEG